MSLEYVVSQWVTILPLLTIGLPLLSLLLILSGAVLGALGSGITLRRFLRV